MTFVVYVAGFSFGGFYIDHKREHGHLFLLLGMALGFAGGVYEAWKLINSLDTPPSHDDDSNPQDK